MEPSSGLNTAIKRRPDEARRPKQKSRNVSQESPRFGYFIKMDRFDKTLDGFRKDSMSHRKTCADIKKSFSK
jgi:hypothetical protein